MLVLIALARTACLQGKVDAQFSHTAKAQITVLYDAFGKNSAMRKHWGAIAFILPMLTLLVDPSQKTVIRCPIPRRIRPEPSPATEEDV
jgi:hypothetical protein